MTADMTAPLVFLDTETTGLTLEDEIWEIAAIRREPDGIERELHLFVDHYHGACAKLPAKFLADHQARYPAVCAEHSKSVHPPAGVVSETGAAAIVRDFTAGAHIVGAVPNFDTERIALLMRRSFTKPAWHYHLIDVENLAVGWLAAKGIEFPLPWRSDDLAALCGVEPIAEADRHTAMGDARWVRAWYDAIMAPAQRESPDA